MLKSYNGKYIYASAEKPNFEDGDIHTIQVKMLSSEDCRGCTCLEAQRDGRTYCNLFDVVNRPSDGNAIKPNIKCIEKIRKKVLGGGRIEIIA
jgi:hypothetical protein